MNQIFQNFEVLAKTEDQIFEVCQHIGESFEKTEQALTIAQVCLSLGLAKQLTQTIGRKLVVSKMKAEDFECFQTIVVSSKRGERLMGGLLPSYKNTVMNLMISYAKIRKTSASFVIDYGIYFLVKAIHTNLTQTKDIDDTYRQLVENTWQLAPQMSARDIDTLGVSQLFAVAKN